MHQLKMRPPTKSLVKTLGTPFEAPVWLWSAINLAIGVASGHMANTWERRILFPVAFGLVLALVGVLDKRLLISRFKGGEALWNVVPKRVKMLFILRLFAARIPVVVLPGVAAAVVAGFLWPGDSVLFYGAPAQMLPPPS